MIEPKTRKLLLTGFTVAFLMTLACFPVVTASSRRMYVTYHWKYYGIYLAGDYSGYRYNDGSCVVWRMVQVYIPATQEYSWPKLDMCLECETTLDFELLNDIIVHYEYQVLEWPGNPIHSEYWIYIFEYGSGGGWVQIDHGTTSSSKTGSVSILQKFETLQNYYKTGSGKMWCKLRLKVMTQYGAWPAWHDVYIDQLITRIDYT